MNCKKLGELVAIIKGRKTSTVFESPINGTHRYIQIADLHGRHSNQFARDDSGVLSKSTDVLLAWDGANAGTIGFGLSGYVGSTLVILRPNLVLVDTCYLGRFLQSKFVYLNSHTTGATIPHISRTILEAIEVPLPPLAEQRRIAAILDKADAIRRKNEMSESILGEILDAAYHKIVGCQHVDYDRWPLVRIEDLAKRANNSLRTGPFGSALRHSEFVDEGIAVLGIDNAVKNRFEWGERRFITKEKYQSLERYTIYPGDVIVTIMGTIGRSAVVPADIPIAITTKHLAAITPNRERIYPEYLSKALVSDQKILRQLGMATRGAIMSGLNLGLIRKLELRCPPLDQQKTYLDFASKAAKMRTRVSQAVIESKSLFAGLSNTFLR